MCVMPGAGALQQPALQRRVHVLVGGGGAEAAGPACLAEVIKGSEQAGKLDVREQPGRVQYSRVRAGGQQVVGGQPPVELDAHGQPGKRLRRARLEPPAPEPDGSTWPDRGPGFVVCHGAPSTFAWWLIGSAGACLADLGALRSRSAAIVLGRPHSS